MKEYNFEVTLVFSNGGIQAESKKKAIEILKESFVEEFGIHLEDEEIRLEEEKEVE